jgi:hypothetical protein
VWFWVAIPFPVSDPYKDNPFPDMPTWPKKPGNHTHHSNLGAVSSGETMLKAGNGAEGGERGEGELPLDVNFYFFLFWYALVVVFQI